MIYLATASGPAARTAIEHGSLGQLVQPNAGNRLVPGATWAADNGCYGGNWNPTRWARWLAALPAERCLFAVVPDVVGDAQATAELWDRHAPTVLSLGLPAAWVAQNGASPADIPDEASAVFLGVLYPRLEGVADVARAGGCSCGECVGDIRHFSVARSYRPPMSDFNVMRVGGRPRESWTVTGPDLLPVAPVDSYLRWCSARELSPGTVKAYGHGLALFFRFLGLRSWDWRTVRLEQVARFIEWLRQPADNVIGLTEGDRRGLRVRAPSTVNKYAAALTGFYEFHAGSGVGVIDDITRWERIARRNYKPFLQHVTKGRRERRSSIRVRDTKRIPETLSVEQVQAVLDVCDRLRDRFLFALLYETGARVGQALGLRHCDMRTWECLVQITPRDDNENGARAKGHRENLVQVRPELVELHADYMHVEYGDLDSNYVFVNLWGGRVGAAMTYSSVDKLVGRIERKVGFCFRPHMLRHSHATELLRYGTRAEVVAKRLSQVGTTTLLSTYEHLEVEDFRRHLDGFWAAREARQR